MPRHLYRRVPAAPSGGPTVVTIYTSAEDGYINANSGVALSVDNSGSSIIVSASSSSYYIENQGFWFFDTSPIPDGATISSATFNTYLNLTDNDPDTDYSFYIWSTAAKGSTLDAGDYLFPQNGFVFQTTNATDFTVGWLSMNISSPNTYINKAGYTNIVCAISLTNPGPGSVAAFDSYENVSGRKAYLSVTYT